MSKRHLVWVLGAVFCVAFFACANASAERNLWISYHFAGLEAYDYGKYSAAHTLLTEAADEAALPKEPKYRLAATLDRLGMVCTAQQDYDSAEDYYLRALCLKEESLGKRSRTIPATLNNLADLYYAAGREPCQSECLYRRALELNKRDQLNIEVCRSLNGLALLHNDAGESVQAEELLKRAIRIHEKALRREHPYLATNLVNLGILYTNQGRYSEAEPLFKRAEYIQDKALGCDHPDVAVRLAAYANLLAKTGHQGKAEACQKKSDEIRAKFAKINAAS